MISPSINYVVMFTFLSPPFYDFHTPGDIGCRTRTLQIVNFGFFFHELNKSFPLPLDMLFFVFFLKLIAKENSFCYFSSNCDKLLASSRLEREGPFVRGSQCR